MNYADYVQSLQLMTVVPTNNTDIWFQQILPRGIEYAELRIYRECDFLTTVSTATGTLTSGSRNLTVPGSIFIVNDINIITPSSETDPDLGTRTPLYRVSIDYINTIWGNSGILAIPQCYTMLTNTDIRFGPFPDANYTAEVIGVVRPAPLSPSNTTTFITQNMPDLFMAASMIFFSGYQQNFGAQSDDPQMAQSWENQYQMLKSGVNAEEMRRKAQSVSWQPYTPSPGANVPRDRGGL